MDALKNAAFIGGELEGEKQGMTYTALPISDYIREKNFKIPLPCVMW